MADFQANFTNLKNYGIIPDNIDESTLPSNVRNVIENLTPEEIKVLQKISDNTGSHLSLHHKNSFPFSVCGL
jgi:hypothetical protein